MAEKSSTTTKTELRPLEVGVGASAAVVTAFAMSYLGTAGTLAGAALASIVGTVSTSVLRSSVERTNESLQRTTARLRETVTGPAPKGGSTAVDPGVAAVGEAELAGLAGRPDTAGEPDTAGRPGDTGSGRTGRGRSGGPAAAVAGRDPARPGPPAHLGGARRRRGGRLRRRADRDHRHRVRRRQAARRADRQRAGRRHDDRAHGRRRPGAGRRRAGHARPRRRAPPRSGAVGQPVADRADQPDAVRSTTPSRPAADPAAIGHPAGPDDRRPVP